MFERWKERKKFRQALKKAGLDSDYVSFFNILKHKKPGSDSELMQRWYDNFVPVFKEYNLEPDNAKYLIQNKCYATCCVCFYPGCHNESMHVDLSLYNVYDGNKRMYENVSADGCTDKIYNYGSTGARVMDVNLHLCPLHVPNMIPGASPGKSIAALLNFRRMNRKAWGMYEQFENQLENRKRQELRLYEISLKNEIEPTLRTYRLNIMMYRKECSKLTQLIRIERAERNKRRAEYRFTQHEINDYKLVQKLVTRSILSRMSSSSSTAAPQQRVYQLTGSPEQIAELRRRQQLGLPIEGSSPELKRMLQRQTGFRQPQQSALVVQPGALRKRRPPPPPPPTPRYRIPRQFLRTPQFAPRPPSSMVVRREITHRGGLEGYANTRSNRRPGLQRSTPFRQTKRSRLQRQGAFKSYFGALTDAPETMEDTLSPEQQQERMGIQRDTDLKSYALGIAELTGMDRDRVTTIAFKRGEGALFQLAVDHIKQQIPDDPSSNKWRIQVLRKKLLQPYIVNAIHSWAKNSTQQQRKTIMSGVKNESIRKLYQQPQRSASNLNKKLETENIQEQRAKNRLVTEPEKYIPTQQTDPKRYRQVLRIIRRIRDPTLKAQMMNAFMSGDTNRMIGIINWYFDESSLVALREASREALAIKNESVRRLRLLRKERRVWGRSIRREKRNIRKERKSHYKKSVTPAVLQRNVELTQGYVDEYGKEVPGIIQKLQNKRPDTDCILYLTGRKKSFGLFAKVKWGFHRLGKWMWGREDHYRDGLIMSAIMYSIAVNRTTTPQTFVNMIEDELVEQYTDEQLGTVRGDRIVVPYYINDSNPFVCTSNVVDVNLVNLGYGYQNKYQYDIESDGQKLVVTIGPVHIAEIKKIREYQLGVTNILFCKGQVTISDHPGNYEFAPIAEYFTTDPLTTYVEACRQIIPLTIPQSCFGVGGTFGPDEASHCVPPVGLARSMMFLYYFKYNMDITRRDESLNWIHSLLESLFKWLGNLFLGGYYLRTLYQDTVWCRTTAAEHFIPDLFLTTAIGEFGKYVEPDPVEETDEYVQLLRFASYQFQNATPFARWFFGASYAPKMALYALTNTTLLAKGYDILTFEMLGI